MKKLLSFTLTFIMVCSVCSAAAGARETWIDNYYYGTGDPFYLNYPTREEIIAKAKELDIDLSHVDGYAQEYSLDPADYQLGKLDDSTYTQALNVLNFYRYVAGLPCDVEIDDGYNELAQAGMLVNAANNTLSHYPNQPEGMSDELYELGREGAGKCNIAWRHESLPLSFQNGWMDDSNKSNIDRAGHRRWILNPMMKYTGFGEVGDFTAMYSLDRSREGRFAGDYIAWPAANTPLDLFVGSLITVSLGASYDDPVADKISVEIRSETQGRSWTVNSKSEDAAFYVNTGSFGIDRCIICKVADFTSDDTLHIRISGITKNGTEAPIEYTANLFSLSSVELDRTTVMTRPSWGADFNYTASSLLSKDTPKVSWRSEDPDVSGIWLYKDRPVYYGVGEGRTTITVYTGGAYVDVDVIVRNSKFLLGDADGDDEVSVLDVTTAQRSLSLITVSEFCDYLFDIDSDEEIGAIDVALVMRWLAERPSNPAIGTGMQSPFTY